MGPPKSVGERGAPSKMFGVVNVVNVFCSFFSTFSFVNGAVLIAGSIGGAVGVNEVELDLV